MTRDIKIPTDKEHWLQLRSKDVTSTDIAVLFGCSPYKTMFELEQEKSGGHVMPFQENERVKWGGVLEFAIAQACSEEEGLRIRPMKEYVSFTDERIGSSFDYAIVDTVDGVTVDTALLEIKNVDSLQFKNGWIENDDGSIEAPLHIELQIQNEMLVSGLNRAELRALVGGNKLHKITRLADEAVQLEIVKRVKEFWQRVDSKQFSPPDFVKDADLIRSMFKFAQPGSMADVTQDGRMRELAAEYRDVSAQIKDLEARKAAARSEMLMAMGDYEKAQGSGFKVSASYIGPKVVEAYERAGYRDFRIYWAKVKE